MKIRIYFTMVILFLFFSNTYAQNSNFESGRITINEVMWTGSFADNHDEWVELKNNTTKEIDISGWIIENAGSSSKSLTIPDGKTIAAYGYFLISHFSSVNNPEKTILLNEADWTTADLSLANSDNGDLILKDPEKNMVDRVKGDLWPAGSNDKKYSMERLADSNDGSLVDSWHTARESKGFKLESKEKGSPGLENSLPLFIQPDSYPESVTRYILLDQAVKTQTEVTRIIDGDTIEVLLDNEIVKVRLLGINAPESANSSEFDIEEPFYQEAKEFVHNGLLNKKVDLLVSKNPNNQYDSYDRLLAAIIINDEVFDIKIIIQGLARSYYLDNEIINSTEWLSEEKTAQNSKSGIWKSLDQSDVIINEFIPNPAGSDSKNEWIELYNQSNTSVDLSNWFLDDAEHGSSPYLIPQNTFINSNNYLIVSILDSGIVLNNSKDSVRLFRPDLTLVQRVDYNETVKEECSYNHLSDGSWQWSFTPTPGKENIITSTVQNKNSKNQNDSDSFSSTILSISQARGQPEGRYITIVGYVNVPPDILSNQYFYLQDDGAGIQVYCYYKDFPDLWIGDKIKVTGELSFTISGVRIKIKQADDIKIIEQNNIMLPILVETGQVNENWEGRLVKIKGTVVETSGDIFYLDDGSGKVKVYLKDSTGIVKPRFQKGISVEVMGVVTRYRDEWRVRPRFQSDLVSISNIQKENNKEEIVATAQAADTNNNSQEMVLGSTTERATEVSSIGSKQPLTKTAKNVIMISSILLIILIGEKYVRKRNN